MTSAGGMNNLTTLIKRLEAATSRLEDIASSTSGIDLPPQTSKATGARTVGEYDNLGAATPSATKDIAPTPSAPSPESSLSSSVRAFDYLVDNELKAFGDFGEAVGGPVAQQTAAFIDSFLIQREILLIVDKAKEPTQTSSIVQEIMQKGAAVAAVLEKNPKSPQDSHLQMGAQGINIIGWVIPGTGSMPGDFISMMEESAEYYGNQVLKAFKGQSTPDVEYVKAFRQLCKSLRDFAKQNYPKGLTWKKDGISPEKALASVRSNASSEPPVPSGPAHQAGPPPPPPPPPLPKFDDMPPLPPPPPTGPSTSRSAGAGDMNAIFDQLNKGESVTSGLRKVDPSQMTHKNPTLRGESSASPIPSKTGPAVKPKPETIRAKKPASKVLDGNRWTIENYEDVSRQSPIRIDAEKQQSILIFRCNSSVVEVVGKANAISVDGCSRLRLIVDDLVSSIEVINSSRINIDINGTLPSIQLDKVDGATVALSKNNAAEKTWPEIFTSKCTSINIGLGLESEEDSVELPVPEQIKSNIVDGRLVSEIVRIDA